MPASAPAAPVGIGLRAPHQAELARRRPRLAFVEVHAENFFAAPAAAALERVRADYALSVHGVGLSLGSADALDEGHLARLAALVRRVEPLLVSEHLSWSAVDGRHANDLLPMPYSMEAVRLLAARIGRVQERLGREIAVENVSAYVTLGEPAMAECEFVGEVVRRAGCRLLLDLNNVWVNAANHGFDAGAYVDAVDPARVAEIHLAGHEATPAGLVDTHGRPVCEAVWDLYARALGRMGPRPTLIEWDTDLPPLETLLGEARRAEALAAAATRAAAAA